MEISHLLYKISRFEFAQIQLFDEIEGWKFASFTSAFRGSRTSLSQALLFSLNALLYSKKLLILLYINKYNVILRFNKIIYVTFILFDSFSL